MQKISFTILLAALALPAGAGQMSLDIADIDSPAFHARAISARLEGGELNRFEVRIGELAVAGRSWRNLALRCSQARLSADEIRCDRGELALAEKLPVRFSYFPRSRALTLNLDFPGKERWQMTATWGNPGWRLKLDASQAQLARLAAFLPQNQPRPSAGVWNGRLDLAGGPGGAERASAELTVGDLAFTDSSGLHAGEKIAATLRAEAKRGKAGWNWQGEVDWRSGEVFWQPLYFARGGHRFSGSGSLAEGRLQLTSGRLSLAGVGEAELAGNWDTAARRLTDFDLNASALDVAGLYGVVLKSFLEKTAFAKLHANGRADLRWCYRNGATTDFNLNLNAADFVDEEQRFALHGVEASIPWSSSEARQARLHLRSGEVLRLALGEVEVPLAMQGWQFGIPALSVPLLDGRLNLEDFSASRSEGAWRWHFGGGLSPVSMERFSAALKLPLMHGTLAGIVPGVSYAGGKLEVNGALLFKVFDGTVVTQGLTLYEPFGRAPRLKADLDMRNLDLDLLTRTFSFGRMQGRIDVEVAGLELSDWRPVRFDARVASSPGSYPKKISQSAVQNISSLGGAGAAAAIQRSFLGFFEQFGYERIGLSCVLRNGVCLMDGVERAPQGYVIVKGGGIPAISVIGYNRQVSWDELLERLQRITQKNLKPVIQ